ncbi:hypothetical protein DYB26_010823 [Aphanomyces astaci]|uniref:Methyltransferase domain-containing protein n=1 Tax=Aphanomyces astaci TaxID=112090 RepID=A0A3R7EBS8_APHAT|nr:hypothetical protein DYB26_010823 [Aphanomyces astaci]
MKRQQVTLDIDVDGQMHTLTPSWEVSLSAQAKEFCDALNVRGGGCDTLLAQEVHTKLLSNDAISTYLMCRGHSSVEGHTSMFPVSRHVLSSLASDATTIHRALQIGFNAGHSAMTILTANPTLHLISFDLVEHPYTPKAAAFLDAVFPGRHKLIPGDSTKTVPEALEDADAGQYDFMFIDGGHTYDVAAADLRNCMRLSRAGTLTTEHVFKDSRLPPIAEATAFCGTLRVYQSDCASLVAKQAQDKLSDVHALASYLNCRGFHSFEGHTSLFPVSVQILSSLVAEPASVRRALQVGFNAGHSTMTMLRANPNVHITSFDLAEHPYVFEAAAYFDVVFPGRHRLVPGDSTTTIPIFPHVHGEDAPFDFVFIDGGHSYEVASADLRNCNRLARAGTIVAMDDVAGVSKSFWTDGPTRAWDDAIASGLVVELGRVESECGNVTPTWVLGRTQTHGDGLYGIAFGMYTGHVQNLVAAHV